jgi:hypothetical protein
LDSIENLGLVINITKHIHLSKNHNDEEIDYDDYASVFPTFVWIVRDFTLALVDKNNDPITSNDYLENALKEIYGYSDDVEAKNRIKKVLKSFFTDRQCMTMVNLYLLYQ